MVKFQGSITENLENFKRRVDLAVQEYQTFNFGNFDSKFNINLQIDNGINGWGVVGGLLLLEVPHMLTGQLRQQIVGI